MSTPNSNYHPDLPTDQDALGFDFKAKQLAAEIQKFDPNYSVVIGVEGRWGEGKSSFLLMMRKHLDPSIQVTEFDPWWFSGKDALLDQLLKQLEKDEAFSKKAIRIGLQQLSAALPNKKAGIETWLDSWLKTAFFTGTIGFLSASTLTAIDGLLNIVWQGGLAILIVTVGVAIISATLQSALKKLQAPKNFSARREVLKKLLKASSTRHLLIMDNIDRLPKEEIREVFRVIKSVLDLPKIHYVLAYDREVIGAALDDFHSGKGLDYLEKIIQLPISLPLPSNELIDAVYHQWFSKLKVLNSVYAVGTGKIENKSYAFGLELIFHELINTPRDARRLINTLQFYERSVENLHPIDLVFLEALRLKNQALWHKICSDLSHSIPIRIARNMGFLPKKNISSENVHAEALEAMGVDLSGYSSLPISLRQCLEFFTGLIQEDNHSLLYKRLENAGMMTLRSWLDNEKSSLRIQKMSGGATMAQINSYLKYSLENPDESYILQQIFLSPTYEDFLGVLERNMAFLRDAQLEIAIEKLPVAIWGQCHAEFKKTLHWLAISWEGNSINGEKNFIDICSKIIDVIVNSHADDRVGISPIEDFHVFPEKISFSEDEAKNFPLCYLHHEIKYIDQEVLPDFLGEAINAVMARYSAIDALKYTGEEKSQLKRSFLSVILFSFIVDNAFVFSWLDGLPEFEALSTIQKNGLQQWLKFIAYNIRKNKTPSLFCYHVKTRKFVQQFNDTLGVTEKKSKEDCTIILNISTVNFPNQTKTG